MLAQQRSRLLISAHQLEGHHHQADRDAYLNPSLRNVNQVKDCEPEGQAMSEGKGGDRTEEFASPDDQQQQSHDEQQVVGAQRNVFKAQFEVAARNSPTRDDQKLGRVGRDQSLGHATVGKHDPDQCVGAAAVEPRNSERRAVHTLRSAIDPPALFQRGRHHLGRLLCDREATRRQSRLEFDPWRA